MDPRKGAFLVFEENPPKKLFFVFWLWFSLKNNRHTNVFLVGIFENALKKVIDRQKLHFGCFWRLITFFVDFKYTDQNSICVSIVFKAKTEKNEEKKLVGPPKKSIFEFWNRNLKKMFPLHFSFVLFFKTIDAQMLFRSVF